MKVFKLYLSLFLFNILPICKAVAQNQTVVNGSTTSPVTFPASGCLYTWTNNTPGIGLAASGVGNIGAFTAINTGSVPVTATITASPVTSGFGYIANLSSNTVSVISTANNSLVATIPVGTTPYGVSVNPDGSRAYVTNASSNTVSVINTFSNAVIATIAVDAAPGGVVVKPDGSQVYVANNLANTISVIDAATNHLISTIAGLSKPQGISVSSDGSRLFVSSGSLNTLTIINTSSASIVSSVVVGVNPLCSVVSPDGRFVYVGNQAGSISVINVLNSSVMATIFTGGTPAGLAISPNGALLYLADPTNQKIDIISTASNTITGTISIPTSPQGISISPDGSRLYATDRGNSVSVINTTSNTVVSKITVGSYPVSLGNFITPDLTCAGVPVSYTITVNPKPVITAGTLTGNIAACQGSASTSLQQFTVTAASLATDIIAAAPGGFEISTSASSGYVNSITLMQTGGLINATVYVRSAASAATGSLSGNVVLSSTGAISQNIPVTATVNLLPTVNTIANQAVFNGSATNAINFTGTSGVFNWVNNTPGIGLAASGTGNIGSFTAVNTTNKPIVATITASPVPSSYAYIANSANGTVSVISTQTKTVIATISVGSYPFGIAVSPDNSFVYVANSNSANVSVISTASNTVIATIPVGTSPQVVAFSRDGTRAYVASNNNTISVINPATHTVIKSIYTAAAPQGIVVSADGSKIYVSNNLAGSVSVIDPIAGVVLNTIAAGSFTCGIALNPAGTRLYTANAGSNTMSVINTATNTVIASPVVPGNPQFITVSADGSKVYVASYGGYISVFDAATNINIISTAESSPRSVGITPDGLSIYLVSGAGYVDVQNLNFSTNTRIPIGTSPAAFGNFMAAGPACTGVPGTFTITVNPTPIIAVGAVTGNISACAGYASSSSNIQYFSVSASGLSADIAATAPPGFEVSLSAGSGYSGSVILNQVAGVVSGTIYVRSSALAPIGNISGNVVLTCTGMQSQNVPVTGIINPLPTANSVANQVVLNGAVTTAINFTGTANTYTWVNDTPGIGLPASGSGNISSFAAVNTGSIPLTAKITVTSLNNQAGFEYMTNGTSNQVSVISNSTNSIVATINVGAGPNGITISPDGSMVYVTNYIGSSVSVINTGQNKVIATVPVSNQPIGITISPDGRKVYVCCDGVLAVIDAPTNTVVKTIGLANFSTGGGLTVSPDGKWIYIADPNNGGLIFMNASTFQKTSLSFPTNIGFPAWAVVNSPDGNLIYVTGGNTHNIYVISAATQTIVKTINLSTAPIGMAISPDGTRLYVTNEYSNSVSVVDAPAGALITTVGVSNSPNGISISPDGRFVYVANVGSDNMSVINTSTNQVIATTGAGATPHSWGNFVKSVTSCSGNPITFTITVNPTPNLSTAGTLTALNTTYGTVSSGTNFTVSGANLTTGVLVTPPPGFEVSLDNVNFNSTITIATTGVISSVSVYARLTSVTAAGTYSGNVVLSSAGAANINVAMPVSTVIPAPLIITANNNSKSYGSILTNTTGSTAFAVTAGSLKNGNTIISVNLIYGTGAAATDAVGAYPSISVAINTSGNGFLNANYNITYSLGNLIVTPAPLTITANGVNKPNGTALTTTTSAAFIATGLQNQETIGTVLLSYGTGSATTDPAGLYPGSVMPSSASGGSFLASNYTITYVNGNLTVEQPIAIIATGSPAALSTVFGTASTSSSFMVSGTGLPAGIAVTPPAGFEVSATNTQFYPTVTIGNGGTIASTPVYIRLIALTPVGNYAGNIGLVSGITTNHTTAMPNSIVAAAPLTISADNKTKVAGTNNPTLTVKYSGFVNSETMAVLSTQATIATTATKASGVGQYRIMAGGAVAPNYTISYIDGILTITPLPLAITIPNTFTPNGDGVNDQWNIPALAFYSNNHVSVYDRLGALVYYSTAYGKPWDGTFKGSQLPVGTYYYVIMVEINKKMETFSGPVSIIR